MAVLKVEERMGTYLELALAAVLLILERMAMTEHSVVEVVLVFHCSVE